MICQKYYWFDIFKYSLIINATTNDNVELNGFEVSVDNSTKSLQSDNKTTVNQFTFGDTHTIVVKKEGYIEAIKTNYVIKDPENIIDFYLPIKEVSIQMAP